MRLDDFRASDNVEDRRGMGGGMGGLPIGRGGLGIGGIVVVLVISYFTGINPGALVGGYESVTGGRQQEQIPSGRTGAPTDEAGKFVSLVLNSTEVAWTGIFQEQVGSPYRPPRLVLFQGATRSACGAAQSAMGPFYCPGDRKVYLDTAFFQEMRTRFNACPTDRGSCAFAQAYVIAHEVGHHVQNILGILPKVNQARQQAGETEGNALSVRTELQADCFAGVWANKTQQRFNFIEAGDVEAALRTAEAIGDDMLQKRSQGYVVPDSFTHGSAAQRKRWFTTGLQSGKLTACNTFNARQL
jgi:predicted metalloprotease